MAADSKGNAVHRHLIPVPLAQPIHCQNMRCHMRYPMERHARAGLRAAVLPVCHSRRTTSSRWLRLIAGVFVYCECGTRTGKPVTVLSQKLINKLRLPPGPRAGRSTALPAAGILAVRMGKMPMLPQRSVHQIQTEYRGELLAQDVSGLPMRWPRAPPILNTARSSYP